MTRTRGIILSLWMLLGLAGCAMIARSPVMPVEMPLGAARPYRGVFHVHSEYSHDSKASLETILNTAKKAGLDFAVITDHNSLEGREAYRNQKTAGHPLLIFGDEISAPDGHLIALGISEGPPENLSSRELIRWIHEKEGFAILAHPLSRKKPWRNWNIEGWDGFEIYDFGHALYEENKIKIAFRALFENPRSFLRAHQKIPEHALQIFREELAGGRRPAVFGAVDAHLHWKLLGWAPENLLLYFQSVTTYAYADRLTEEAIVEALGRGRSFIAFEAFGPAHSFIFSASSGGRLYRAGESFFSGSGAAFAVEVPVRAAIRLYLNGQILKQAESDRILLESQAPGNYHVEIYRDDRLWILTHAIQLQAEDHAKI